MPSNPLARTGSRHLRWLFPGLLLGGITWWLLLQAGASLIRISDLAAPDAILALASHEWERLPAVTRLAHTYPDARVLLTEPVKPTMFNCHLCAGRPEWLVSRGVDRARIAVLPRRVTNTYDEALAAREYCREHSIRRLIVVTSPYHTRRALATFSSVLGAGTAVGVYPSAESPATPDRWWTAPYDRAYVAYEWTALVWYAVRHHVSPFA